MSEICQGCPEEFVMFLAYCRSLEFEQRPDYNYLRRLLRDVATTNGLKYDWKYDWILKQESNSGTKSRASASPSPTASVFDFISESQSEHEVSEDCSGTGSSSSTRASATGVSNQSG